jgi:hypothetical protein
VKNKKAKKDINNDSGFRESGRLAEEISLLLFEPFGVAAVRGF